MTNYRRKEEIDFLSQVIRKKTKCYIISPHLDDAVLSCGGLIKYLYQRKINVDVINVFTHVVSGALSLPARRFMNISGYDNDQLFFNDRRKEDADVLHGLGVNIHNLGYEDALWRKKKMKNTPINNIFNCLPGLLNIYPITFRKNISNHDAPMIQEIKKDIVKLITNKDFISFFPSGIGEHVDHLILRNIGLEYFPTAIFYADYPYRLTYWLKNNDPLSEYQKYELKNKDKVVLIKKYKTQINCLFPNGLPEDTSDIFFYPN